MPLNEGTFEAVNNSNFKAVAEQPAIYANMALRNAVEAQEALSQIGRSSLQAHHQAMSAHGQTMVGMGQLLSQLLATFQMGAATSASKAVEDQRTIDPKDARAEGMLLDPALWAGRDVGAMRSLIREELQAALVGLAGVREGNRSGGQ